MSLFTTQTNFKNTKRVSGFKNLSGFSSNKELSPDELLEIARSEGGSLADRAEELAHVDRSILATMGNGFKNAFTEFVDIISTPSNVVAGVLSSDITIKEAMDKNITPSDVLFGEKNPYATTMEKVGGFVVRTAVDIISDPLTYVTFGAGRGVFGIASLPKITLGEKVVEKLGKTALDAGVITHAVSETGDDLLKVLKIAERQSSGMSINKKVAKNLKKLKSGKLSKLEKKTGIDIIKEAEDELENLLRISIDSKLNPDFTKRAVSNLLEKYPQLADTILDKGGIKYFGKTILSGQRIRQASALIPGLSIVDHIAQPIRGALQAPFNPNIQKVGKEYIRMPEEWTNLIQKSKDISQNQGYDILKNLSDVVTENKLSYTELELLMSNVATRIPPKDSRLFTAYNKIIGINDEALVKLRKAGININALDNYTGNVLVPNNVSKISWNTKPTKNVGVAKQAKFARFIEQKEGVGANVLKEVPELEKVSPEFTNLIKEKKSVQEVMSTIGEEITNKVNVLSKTIPVDEAIKSEEVSKLYKLLDDVDKLKKTPEFSGTAENLKLKPDSEDFKFFKDNEGRIFKRVQATAQAAEEAGFANFDKNIMTSTATRLLKTENQLLGCELLRSAAVNFGKSAKEAPHGWVSISGTNEFVANVLDDFGEEILFHPAMAKSIEEYSKALINDDITNGMLKAFDKMQNMWKAGVTSIFPAFHGRNGLSNNFLNFADIGFHVLDPVTSSLSLDLLNKERKYNKLSKIASGSGEKALIAKDKLNRLTETVVFEDSIGFKYTFGELRDIIKENNIAFNKNITGMTDVVEDQAQMIEFFFPKKNTVIRSLNMTNPNEFAPTKLGLEVGRTIEGHARLVNFITNLRKTGDVAHAAQRTKMFLFDYGNLTNFEKMFLRRVFPFYSFTRKNLEMQVRTLLTAPGRTKAQITAITNLSDVLSGQELTKEEKDMLPDWIKSGINILSEREGNKISIIQSLGTPIEQPFQQFQANQMLGSISPLIRVPIEQTSGYDFFREKPLSEVTNAVAFKKAPAAIKDFIGYTEVTYKDPKGKDVKLYRSLRPERMSVILNLPFVGRTLSSLKQMQTADVSTQYKILQQIIGVRPYTLDLEKEAQKREDELRKDLEDLLKTSGKGYRLDRFILKK